MGPLYRRQTPRTLPMYPILTSQGHTAPCGFLCALSVGVYSERNIHRNSIKGTQINLSVLCGDFLKKLFCDGHKGRLRGTFMDTFPPMFYLNDCKSIN